jgi:hypothetical protein
MQNHIFAKIVTRLDFFVDVVAPLKTFSRICHTATPFLATVVIPLKVLAKLEVPQKMLFYQEWYDSKRFLLEINLT